RRRGWVLGAMNRGHPLRRLAVLERGLVRLAVVLVGAVVSGGGGPPWIGGSALEFLCIPPLIFAAFRFGPRAASTCVVLLALVAILGTWSGQGAFARDSQNESLLLLQAFLATLTIVTIPLAAVVRERELGE